MVQTRSMSQAIVGDKNKTQMADKLIKVETIINPKTTIHPKKKDSALFYRGFPSLQ